MKTRELVRKAEEMGYVIINDETFDKIFIMNKNSYYDKIVLTTEEEGLNINGDFDKDIIKLATEYVSTPVEERYEELYVVRLPEVSVIYGVNSLVLTFDKYSKVYNILSESDEKRDERFIQGFTEEEFENIPEFYKQLGVLEKC